MKTRPICVFSIKYFIRISWRAVASNLIKKLNESEKSEIFQIFKKIKDLDNFQKDKGLENFFKAKKISCHFMHMHACYSSMTYNKQDLFATGFLTAMGLYKL